MTLLSHLILDNYLEKWTLPVFEFYTKKKNTEDSEVSAFLTQKKTFFSDCD